MKSVLLFAAGAFFLGLLTLALTVSVRKTDIVHVAPTSFSVPLGEVTIGPVPARAGSDPHLGVPAIPLQGNVSGQLSFRLQGATYQAKLDLPPAAQRLDYTFCVGASDTCATLGAARWQTGDSGVITAGKLRHDVSVRARVAVDGCQLSRAGAPVEISGRDLGGLLSPSAGHCRPGAPLPFADRGLLRVTAGGAEYVPFGPSGVTVRGTPVPLTTGWLALPVKITVLVRRSRLSRASVGCQVSWCGSERVRLEPVVRLRVAVDAKRQRAVIDLEDWTRHVVSVRRNAELGTSALCTVQHMRLSERGSAGSLVLALAPFGAGGDANIALQACSASVRVSARGVLLPFSGAAGRITVDTGAWEHTLAYQVSPGPRRYALGSSAPYLVLLAFVLVLACAQLVWPDLVPVQTVVLLSGLSLLLVLAGVCRALGTYWVVRQYADDHKLWDYHILAGYSHVGAVLLGLCLGRLLPTALRPAPWKPALGLLIVAAFAAARAATVGEKLGPFRSVVALPLAVAVLGWALEHSRAWLRGRHGWRSVGLALSACVVSALLVGSFYRDLGAAVLALGPVAILLARFSSALVTGRGARAVALIGAGLACVAATGFLLAARPLARAALAADGVRLIPARAETCQLPQEATPQLEALEQSGWIDGQPRLLPLRKQARLAGFIAEADGAAARTLAQVPLPEAHEVARVFALKDRARALSAQGVPLGARVLPAGAGARRALVHDESLDLVYRFALGGAWPLLFLIPIGLVVQAALSTRVPGSLAGSGVLALLAWGAVLGFGAAAARLPNLAQNTPLLGFSGASAVMDACALAVAVASLTLAWRRRQSI